MGVTPCEASPCRISLSRAQHLTAPRENVTSDDRKEWGATSCPKGKVQPVSRNRPHPKGITNYCLRTAPSFLLSPFQFSEDPWNLRIEPIPSRWCFYSITSSTSGTGKLHHFPRFPAFLYQLTFVPATSSKQNEHSEYKPSHPIMAPLRPQNDKSSRNPSKSLFKMSISKSWSQLTSYEPMEKLRSRPTRKRIV
jgi:hypothetical protein